MFSNEQMQAFRSDRGRWGPGYQGEARRQLFPDLTDKRYFPSASLNQDRVAEFPSVIALVDDPPERCDARPCQIRLQPGSFMHGGGFRKRHQQDAGKVAIA